MEWNKKDLELVRILTAISMFKDKAFYIGAEKSLKLWGDYFTKKLIQHQDLLSDYNNDDNDFYLAKVDEDIENGEFK